jgi:diguanylate cyclase (GGDEF)-like protein
MPKVRRFFHPALLLIAFAVLLANSVIFYRSLDHLDEATRSVKHTLQVRQTAGDLFTALLDAETGQRGFLVTSDHRYLAPYHLAVATLQTKLAELRDLVSDNPDHGKRMDQLAALADEKLAEMEAVVTKHIAEGTEASRRQVQEDHGRQVMDRIRTLFQSVNMVEDRLLDQRTSVYLEEQKTAFFSLIIFVINVLLLLGAIYLFMRRELRQRNDADRRQQEYVSTLDKSLRTLQRERNDIAALNEFTNFVQSCASVEEVGQITGPFMGGILPEYSGALYLYADSSDQLTLMQKWGTTPMPAILTSDGCWGLRRGQPHHHTHDLASPACFHLHDSARVETLCVPLGAQGSTLGLLTLMHSGSADTNAENTLQAGQRRGLINMIARQLSLALANLQLRESLKEQSIRDPLTGAFNRRYFNDVAEKELAQARRFGRSFALIMVDIDHFKRFNDDHGHSSGDAVLVAVSSYLQGSMREGDWMFRYGGEEFVLLLREANARDAEQKAQDLRKGISSLTIKLGEGSLPRLTVSMGIAEYPQHGDDLQALIEKADAALYASKEAGRNRITLANLAA